MARVLPALARGATVLLGAHVALRCASQSTVTSCAPAQRQSSIIRRPTRSRSSGTSAETDGTHESNNQEEQEPALTGAACEPSLTGDVLLREAAGIFDGENLEEDLVEAAEDPTYDVNKPAKHKDLGEGAIRKGPNAAKEGRVLFEWTRLESVGRARVRKKVVLNRWVHIEELQLLMQHDATDAVTDAVGEAEDRVPATAGNVPPLVDAPLRADHERERKRKENPVTANPWKLSGEKKTKTVKHISAEKMIREHFAESFLVPDAMKKNYVFCRACKHGYPLIKSSITAHVQSSKHEAAVKKLLHKKEDDHEVQNFLEDYFKEHPQEQTATLSKDVQLYRYRTVEALLGNGIPLNKVGGLRPLLERSGIALTDHSHLASMVPRLLEREKKRLKKELHGQYITFVFDGTTRLGEAVNVVCRYCPSDFKAIEQRLVSFATMKKHMNGNELGRHLMDVLRSLDVPYELIVASSRDSCATNGAGLRVISPFLPSMMCVLCYSHMLQGTGSRLNFDCLDAFLAPFISLQTMAIVRSLWKEIVGTSMKGYSHIRWWSRWELMKDLATAFGPTLDKFVHELAVREVAEDTTRKLQAFLLDPAKRESLELELAVAMDLEPLVKTTYELEGDGLCILKAYDKVEELRRLGRTLDHQMSLPNAAAVLRSRAKLQDGVKFRQYWSEEDCPGGAGWYEGIVLGKNPGHGHLCAVRYSTGDEMWIFKSEEKTFRGHILAHSLPEWQTVKNMVQLAFKYIEDRLTNECDAPYHLKEQHSQMQLLKVHVSAESS